jgi:hypothetical protein
LRFFSWLHGGPARLISSEAFSTGIGSTAPAEFPAIIAAAWPGATVGVVLRSPLRLLESKYVAAVLQNHRPTVLSWPEWLMQAAEKGVLRRLIYDEVLRRYRETPGIADVWPILDTALLPLAGEPRFERRRVQGWGRRFHIAVFGANRTPRHRWIERAGLAHNRATAPLWRIAARWAPSRWASKCWLWYGRRAVVAAAERLLPSRSVGVRPLPEWFRRVWLPVYERDERMLERRYGRELYDAPAWLARIEKEIELLDHAPVLARRLWGEEKEITNAR